MRRGQLIGQGGVQSGVIPAVGMAGLTDVSTAQILVGFGPTAHASLSTALRSWLPRTVAHEVDHSVKTLGGPGVGATLLDSLVSEGVASAFDTAAFPGRPHPWTDAISPAQQCTMWKLAEPLLRSDGRYCQWMFGFAGVPHWTGFTLGNPIVRDDRFRHRHESWGPLTDASAATVLAGSHDDPCTR